MTYSFDNSESQCRDSKRIKSFIRTFSALFGVGVIIFSIAMSAFDMSESSAVLSVKNAFSLAASAENRKTEISFSADTFDRLFLHSATEINNISEDTVQITPPEENITEDNTENVAEPIICDSSDLYSFGSFVYSDLSGNPTGGEILIRNETGYSPDISGLLKHYDSVSAVSLSETESKEYAVIEIFDSESNTVLYSANNETSPVVLILHTHGTECFNTDGEEYYTEDEACFRTRDTDINMISVGAYAAVTLAENGVTAIHCRIMHDEESYNNSYYYESQTIKKLLSLYPSIRFILDMHRDAIGAGDNCMVRPVTSTADGDAAQIMFVCGSDWLGANHPSWQDNLALAVLLQSCMNTRYHNIMRPICLRGATYNEHYSSGSLLVEIGSCGNSIDEAKLAARLLAKQLAICINNGIV